MDQPAIDESHPRRRAALAFIYITVVLDMLAFGIVIPVLPHLIEQLALEPRERQAGAILVSTRWAADQQQTGIRITRREHHVGRHVAQRTPFETRDGRP